MEFLPGGDMMTMLMRYDTFSEETTRFYVAECALAINSIHRYGGEARGCIACVARQPPISRRRFRPGSTSSTETSSRTTCCWTRRHAAARLTSWSRCACGGLMVVRRQGHIVLSDFGLCTGLKKSHQTDYYRTLMKARGAVQCLQRQRSVPTRASRAGGAGGRE